MAIMRLVSLFGFLRMILHHRILRFTLFVQTASWSRLGLHQMIRWLTSFRLRRNNSGLETCSVSTEIGHPEAFSVLTYLKLQSVSEGESDTAILSKSFRGSRIPFFRIALALSAKNPAVRSVNFFLRRLSFFGTFYVSLPRSSRTAFSLTLLLNAVCDVARWSNNPWTAEQELHFCKPHSCCQLGTNPVAIPVRLIGKCFTRFASSWAAPLSRDGLR